MIEKNEIAKVWYIENNQLKNSNKRICKTYYRGQEIAILKSKRNWYYADMLIKDKDNIYWELNIAPICFEDFVSANMEIMNGYNKESKYINYCNDIYSAISKLDLKDFFIKMIDKKEYFNKCQLKFIEKNYPDIYQKAKNSRENFLQVKRVEKDLQKIKEEKANQDEVKITNEIFEDKLFNIKLAIRLDKEIQVENLKFYKDNKYENGITEQNCLLYLARQYGIKIPLATQGFINNKLVSYDFGNGTFAYKLINNNRRPSVEMHKYLAQISKKVKEEFLSEKDKLKEKINEMKGRNK